MNPYGPRILTAVPQTLHAQLEIVRIALALAGLDENELLWQRRAEIAAIRRDLDVLKRVVRALGEELPALVMAELQSELKKYSPDQPRVPAGNPDGGQWVGENGDASREDPRVGADSVRTGTRYAADIPGDANNNSEVLSDATPDNMWISGAQYAAGWEHHFVPWATFNKYTLQPQTREVFVDATSGPLADTRANRWSSEHAAYNEAVDEAFISYLERNNIPADRTERLTPAQANEFLDEVFYSSDTRIRSFNMRIWREAFRYWRRSAGRGGGDEE
jgi:hypothetical protein